MDITVKLFDKICRACLCESNDMKSLFTKMDGEERSLLDVLAFTANLNIKSEDNLPKQVCGECQVIMCKADAFKRRCLQSDNILTNLYEGNVGAFETLGIGKQVHVKQEIGVNYEIITAKQVFAASGEQNSEFNDTYDKKEVINEISLCFTEENVNEPQKHTEDIKIHKITAVKEELAIDFDADHFNDSELTETLPDREEFVEEKPKAFICHCGVSFDTKDMHNRHLKLFNCDKYKKMLNKYRGKSEIKPIKIKNQIPCQKCEREFRTVSTWIAHQQTHKDDKGGLEKNGKQSEETELYECSLCSRKFKNRKSLSSHIKRHEMSENVKYTCDQCKREFKYKAYLDNHIVSVHASEKGFSCDYCLKSFSSKESMEVHREMHKIAKKHQCTVCNKSFLMLCTLKEHLRTHTGEKPFLCSICGRGFSQKTNLAQHMRRHQGLKPYRCETCEKRFVSKGELEAHNRKHSGAHPFVCDDCGNGFTTSSALVKHRRTHTGERPYACDLCPMSFAASGTLKNHRRTHTGERPFQCSYCEKAFVQRNDLISHIRSHTGERPFVCSQCGHAFRKSAALKAHIRMHAKEPNAMSMLHGVNVLLNGINCDGQQ